MRLQILCFALVALVLVSGVRVFMAPGTFQDSLRVAHSRANIGQSNNQTLEIHPVNERAINNRATNNRHSNSFANQPMPSNHVGDSIKSLNSPSVEANWQTNTVHHLNNGFEAANPPTIPMSIDGSWNRPQPPSNDRRVPQGNFGRSQFGSTSTLAPIRSPGPQTSVRTPSKHQRQGELHNQLPNSQSNQIATGSSIQAQASRPFQGQAHAQTRTFNSPWGVQEQPAQPALSVFAQIVKDIPASAENVTALVRASYAISSSDAEKMADVLAQANTSIETTTGEDRLTVTCAPGIHQALSRYVSTFYATEPIRLNQLPSGPAWQNDNVQDQGNPPRQVTQATYQPGFEPRSLGFSASAENVQVLLRADYLLPTKTLKPMQQLLQTKTRVLLESKLVAEDDSEAAISTLTVTTTRDGQLAVAHLIEALFKPLPPSQQEITSEVGGGEREMSPGIADEPSSMPNSADNPCRGQQATDLLDADQAPGDKVREPCSVKNSVDDAGQVLDLFHAIIE